MSILTFQQISNFDTASRFKESRALYKSIVANSSSIVTPKDLFLSHSSLDNSRLDGVIKFFEKFNASVYVDDGDERLPEIPSVNTARILRRRIKSLKRFVMLLSPASYESNWIPWEIGLAHGYKGRSSVALLPTAQNPDGARWVKRHYLGLYPRIIYGKLKGHENAVWQVYDPGDDTSWLLRYWLHQEI